jgi:hypothetical protein
MTVIRVSPESVQGYGREAQRIFNDMHAKLEALVNDVVGVRYFGPYAVSFKKECGQIAADFAQKLSADIAAMADAVRTSTSNIAASLGGQPITISVDSKAIVPPTPETVDYVDVDTDALEQLKTPVSNHFTALDGLLGENLTRLQSTDWSGTAKDNAVQAVTAFTNSAKAKVSSAQTSILNYITQQLSAVIGSDR